ncbi:type III pantothenate kinase [Rheinheimera riviphila]|uniref:Type III pantothenate kinase n=1 Tax=Rheinheimera riviphila TaxID=1834037 RepID=A0A437QF35_9GAMM|nr:type III pantothenate kinase [Rheinheimera riviphila]RVU32999.1 type III pantothenate kinase [Rheinheimera riviphila]
MAELLLDIGNSRTKAVLHQDGRFTLLPDHFATSIQQYDISAVFCASVARDERIAAVREETGLQHVAWRIVHSEATKSGLRSQYTEPHLLGVDRWLAMLGAIKLWPAQSLMVVDAGTALTLDWVDESGQHLGGWIIPGFRLQQQAVIGQTAKVFNNSMQHAQVALGTDTSSCLQNGCLSAAVAVILQGFSLQTATKVVLTGGDANLLMPHLTQLDPQVEPLLIFRGLSLYI